jgi:hypothetical protein
VSAFFGRRELVLEVDARGARLDHRLHELERIQSAAEAGFGVGNHGRHPVEILLAVHVGDLIGAQQGLVDAPHQHGYAVDGVEALIRVGLGGRVIVPRHLPAADVERLEAGLDHLHRLVAGDGAQRPHERLGVEDVPQPFGAHPRQGVFDDEAAAQPQHLVRGVRADDARPTRRCGPIFRHPCSEILLVHGCSFSSRNNGIAGVDFGSWHNEIGLRVRRTVRLPAPLWRGEVAIWLWTCGENSGRLGGGPLDEGDVGSGRPAVRAHDCEFHQVARTQGAAAHYGGAVDVELRRSAADEKPVLAPRVVPLHQAALAAGGGQQMAAARAVRGRGRRCGALLFLCPYEGNPAAGAVEDFVLVLVDGWLT